MHRPQLPRARFKALVVRRVLCRSRRRTPGRRRAPRPPRRQPPQAAARPVAEGRRLQGRRLLHRMGHLRPQVPRQEHRDIRFGRPADPHQLRLRQRHRRQVRDGRRRCRDRAGRTPPPSRWTGSPTPASQPLRGNFNQLRELKKKHPNLKVLWSFGGWTWSSGFGEAAQNPAAFAKSCYDLVENSKWADVFDGIDIDWEYPNACGCTCDTSGRAAFRNVMAALRAKFGAGNLVTAAITADATAGGKIDAADYAGAAKYVDWYNPMTYDYFGAWAATGPDRAALGAELVLRHPPGRLQHLGDHRQAQGPRHPGVEAAARHRLLRARLDRRHPGRRPAARRPARRRVRTRRASRTTRC